MEGDFEGARRSALKAQNLFPGLDGLSQFMEVVNLHINSEKKINGKQDRYAILGVDPSANEEEIKKSYRRMALALHPDKNKSVGAEGAFKILIQAWSILSDKTKRMAYNLKLNSSSSYYTPMPPHPQTPAHSTYSQYNPTPLGPRTPAPATYYQYSPMPPPPRTQAASTHYPCSPSPPCPKASTSTSHINHPFPQYRGNLSTNTSHQYTPPPHSKNPTPSAPTRPTLSSSGFRPETFWTSCRKCMIEYEYSRMYLNLKLRCRKCRLPFIAREVLPPTIDSHYSSSHGPVHWQQGHLRQSGSLPGVPPLSTRDTHTKQQAQLDEGLKRGHDVPANGTHAPGMKNIPAEKAASSKASNLGSRTQKRGRPGKMRRVDVRNSGSEKEGNMHQMAADSRVGHGDASAPAINKAKSKRIASDLEIRNMLMWKAKRELLKKLSECSNVGVFQNSPKEGMQIEKNKPKASRAVRKESFERGGNDKRNTSCKPQKSSVLDITDDMGTEVTETIFMSVPDADFCNFDKDRIEDSFVENQVWALYDDKDGMPRFYALIREVISKEPFKVRISWLNSSRSNEFGPLYWIGSGFTKTSGEFTIGRSEFKKTLNFFSHVVKWKRGARGSIQIVPGKGEVWALYKNWSPNWGMDTPDEEIYKYEIVEVLGDYTEEHSVSIVPLVKTNGFSTVFHKHEPEEIRAIPGEEMFRFSHQVPFYQLTGKDTQSLIHHKDLDPAALPGDLLQVMSET